MLGESYDARLETAGWDQPGFDAHAWHAATLREEKERELDPQVCPSARATAELPPVVLTGPAPGRQTYDLGQNMVGVVLCTENPAAGGFTCSDARINQLVSNIGWACAATT